LKIVYPDYWEHQKRINNESMDHIRKKTSQSDYHLNTTHRNSGSLNNIHSINKNQLKYGRYSVCELDKKKSSFITNKQRRSTNSTYQNSKTKTNDFYHRRSSDRYLFNPKKNSLSSNTSTSSYIRGQPVHYITYKRESNQKKFFKQQLSASNLTRSTMNTSSESSFLLDQNKLTKTVSNHGEQ